MPTRICALLTVTLLATSTQALSAQTPIDSALASYIDAIRAVDHHAHPMRPVPPGAPADTEFDALPLDAIPPFPVPWRLTLDNPEWAESGAALYGVSPDALPAARERVAREQGEHFPEWVLDRAGIEVMFANRIALGSGLAPPRFRWVPFADPLLLPLDTRVEAARTPDTRGLYPKEEKLLRRYLSDLGLSSVPATLDEYVSEVLTPTLDRQRRDGAIAVKFEAAYLRTLHFADPDPARAREVYARYAAGGTPSHEEYTALEDYLFRVIARQAGRLGMAIHIHVLDGFGGFYDATGATPAQLEPAFNDSTLRATNFVIVHGGWPHVDETEAMIGKPNVYADISMMVLILEPARLAAVLRGWLARWPDKVMFGTDAFDGGAQQGWGEVAYFGARTARRALAMALTGMMRDGEITRDRALELARMVLRDNANHLYDLGLK